MPLLTSVLGITGNITSILLLLSPIESQYHYGFSHTSGRRRIPSRVRCAGGREDASLAATPLTAPYRPTFWVIVKKKTTGSYSAQPYLFSLLSAMLWTYYGCLQMKKGGFLVLITISAISCSFYTLYLTCYLFFASKSQRERTGWFLLAIVCFFTSTIISSRKLLHGGDSLMAVGLLCTVISCFSNAAPLSIMRRVIKTKSVKYMPFSLSLCLFLNGLTWLAYALCLKDLYLTVTNALGVLLATVQLGLYTFYRNYGLKSQQVVDEDDLNMKANNMEIADIDTKICSGRASRTTSNLEMEVKICSGRVSRTSSNAAAKDFINSIVDLPQKVTDICGLIEPNMITGSTLRKLPTPRSISICAQLSLDTLPHNTT